MFARRPLFTTALALVACADRPLGETESGTSTGTTSEPPAGTTTATTTASPGTTIEPTTAVPPLPTTTATSDDSAGTTAGPIIFDVLTPLPPSLMGCSLDAPPGTMITGATDLGPFAAQRAYFGWIGFDGQPFVPLLLFVSPAADPAVEVVQTQGNTGAILYGDVGTDPFNEGGWIGEWPAPLTVFDQGQLSQAMKSPKVTIDALAGNWSEFDPADPPRLVGSMQGAFTGPFDAVFCDELNEQIIAE